MEHGIKLYTANKEGLAGGSGRRGLASLLCAALQQTFLPVHITLASPLLNFSCTFLHPVLVALAVLFPGSRVAAQVGGSCLRVPLRCVRCSGPSCLCRNHL